MMMVAMMITFSRRAALHIARVIRIAPDNGPNNR